MVKGVNRRIILVDSPEPELFDQAIFILRGFLGGQKLILLLRGISRIQCFLILV